MIRLYDSLTRQVRPLRLRAEGEMSMYVCGPTTYDHPHLGHARSALTYDVLRRYLQWRGISVRHVANVTDIDDKIIARARREGRTEPEVARHWEDVYINSMRQLGVLDPTERPRATEWVDEMVGFVERLVAAGAAYETPSGVYLRVRHVDGYGDLVHRDLAELRASAGGRVEVDERKEDPLDFALWKAAKQSEPAWPSPWGPGRPGWHIECAAMSLSLLGDGFDLHGGGDDLLFPHHTNERAEAVAAGRHFCNHWMHNAMLNVDGAKMAKSLGNYRTVADLLSEHPRNARALRLLVLQTHYRKTMEVNAKLLASARAAVGRLDALARRASVLTDPPGAVIVAPRKVSGPSDVVNFEVFEGLEEHAARAFTAAMDDDLATPQSVAVIFDTLRRANAAIDAGSADAPKLARTVRVLSGALGLFATRSADVQETVSADAQVSKGTGHVIQPTGEAIPVDDDMSRIETLVSRRDQARKRKDWQAADSLREELAAMGVTLEDTPTGTIWRRGV